MFASSGGSRVNPDSGDAGTAARMSDGWMAKQEGAVGSRGQITPLTQDLKRKLGVLVFTL
jgi:hypothetical protein